MSPEEERYRYLQLKAKAAQAAAPVEEWAFPDQEAEQLGPKTIQEQHPDISVWDRLVTKNLATNPESVVKYLARKHPNLQVELDTAGQVKIKRPEETDYRVLDPDTGISGGVGELIKDIGDVGYDVASGIVQGAATAGAGIAGAAGGGVGAIPAAMGAGAASGAGLEGIRQGLGSLAGLEDNADLGQIGMAGAIGAASPALFGTGASLANIEGKGLAGKLAQAIKPTAQLDDVGKELLQRSQRGIPTRMFEKGVDKLAPSIASKISGVSKLDVEDLQKNLKGIRNIESNPEAIQDLAETTVRDSAKKLSSYETKLYEEVVAETGEKGIDVRDAFMPWVEKRKELARAARAANATPDDIEAFQDFVKLQDKTWGKAKGALNENFFKRSPEQLRTLQGRIADLAQFDEGIKVKGKLSDLSPVERELASVARKSYNGFNQSLEKVSTKIPDLKKRIAEIIKYKSYIQKNLGRPEQFVNRMKLASGGRHSSKILTENLKKVDALVGTKFDSARGLLNAAEKFGEDVPILSTKRIPAAALGAIAGYGLSRTGQGEGFVTPGVTTGMLLGTALGGPRAVRQLLEWSRKTGGGLSPTMVQQINPSVWNMLRTSEGQK
jgi:hypothetical protein